ncbi:N-acetylneuraminate synthase family protein [Maridesulfovibrio sp. FT414]|uniref:N-acetylneuraminate synthase family protein n=1 Tax=Maridesulfovibrio sp. FT414 TaxID=2979469 RepID=UPI003D806D9F
MNTFFLDQFSIGDTKVGTGQPCYTIAEAGVAHFGSMEKAHRLVDLAVEAKADAVKFQIFQTDELISSASGEWKDRLRSKELPYQAFSEIADYCAHKGITFLATAHDEPSLNFLDTLNVPAYKIGSGEVSNWPFLEMIASRGKPVILSTGMYTAENIADALNIFHKASNPQIAVLHCVTSYPTPPSDVNLRAMAFIKDKFRVVTGFSDHTEGFHIPLAAVALGAQVIEKHITLDFNIPNAQDWKVSCGPDNLGLFISQIRDIEDSLGICEKKPVKSEITSIDWARKSIVSASQIKKGTILSKEHFVFKRPGTGIPPSEIGLIIGRTAKSDIAKDTAITQEMLCE